MSKNFLKRNLPKSKQKDKQSLTPYEAKCDALIDSFFHTYFRGIFHSRIGESFFPLIEDAKILCYPHIFVDLAFAQRKTIEPIAKDLDYAFIIEFYEEDNSGKALQDKIDKILRVWTEEPEIEYAFVVEVFSESAFMVDKNMNSTSLKRFSLSELLSLFFDSVCSKTFCFSKEMESLNSAFSDTLYTKYLNIC